LGLEVFPHLEARLNAPQLPRRRTIMIQNTTNTPITTLHQHLVQLSAGLRLPPVAAALQEAGLAHLPVGVVVAVTEAVP
jgi:hypothetical protein